MLEYGSRGNNQGALVYTTVLKGKSCKESWKHIIVEFTLQICNRLSKHMNSLTPQSDQHLISPYNITPELNKDVVRIKVMIINKRSS